MSRNIKPVIPSKPAPKSPDVPVPVPVPQEGTIVTNLVGSFADCKTFDQVEAKRKERLALFHELVDAYLELSPEDLRLHGVATQRAADRKGLHGVNPERRLTGADRIAISRIALGTAGAYIKLTGAGHTIGWDQLDEITRMQLTTFVMELHRQYNDPTYAHLDSKVLGKLSLCGEATDIFISTCRMLIRTWLSVSDSAYVL